MIKEIQQLKFSEIRNKLRFAQTASDTVFDNLSIDELLQYQSKNAKKLSSQEYIDVHKQKRLQDAFTDIHEVMTLTPIILIDIAENDKLIVLDGRQRLLAISQLPKFETDLNVITLYDVTLKDVYNIFVTLHSSHRINFKTLEQHFGKSMHDFQDW
mgnify:FL=1